MSRSIPGVVPTAEADCNHRNSDDENNDDDDDDDNYSQSSYVCQFNHQSSKWECVKAVSKGAFFVVACSA